MSHALPSETRAELYATGVTMEQEIRRSALEAAVRFVAPRSLPIHSSRMGESWFATVIVGLPAVIELSWGSAHGPTVSVRVPDADGAELGAEALLASIHQSASALAPIEEPTGPTRLFVGNAEDDELPF